MNEDQTSADRKDERSPAQEPEPFEPPQLVELGSYADLTLGMGVKTSDMIEFGS